MAGLNGGKKVVFRLEAIFYEDGSVYLGGIPRDLDAARNIRLAINNGIESHFLKAAREGRLNEAGLIQEPAIVVPKNKIVSIGER